MSLNAALEIGRSGLLTSQSAIQTVGNNLANISTRGYHRQEVSLSPIPNKQIAQGIFLGQGVQLDTVTRVVSEALEARLRSSIGDEAYASVRSDQLTQIESIQNELTDTDLSTRLTAFFNSWSQLANNPQDLSLRTLVVQEASTLADYVQTVRNELGTMKVQLDGEMDQATTNVNDMLDQIEALNQRIAVADQGSGKAAGLRDQRDVALAELGKYLDVSTVEGHTGMIDIYVGSLPIMLNGKSRGVQTLQESVNGELQIDVVIAEDQSSLDISTGELGALAEVRLGDLE
ncbi:MAG: flagellar hook-associated protein FlgK, partial [Rhodospirillales bacterium]|nr:flagellar hook-associated protein FlgK [Rhodospirillales bacterium]